MPSQIKGSVGSSVGRRAPQNEWDQIKAESLSAKIVNQVRASLFDRELKPGDFLGTETSLAEQFGVSRMASRDALRSLAASGIVTVKQGAKGGAWISSGAIDHLSDSLAIQMTLLGVSMKDVLELQSGIEAIASELAAERATEDDIVILRKMLDAVVKAADQPRTYARLAFDLHEQVVRTARNDAMLAQFRGIRRLLEPINVGRSTKETVKASLPAHKVLVELIAANDGPGAWTHAHDRMRAVRAKSEELA
jgi:GntR family transcriptional regulator, transcriptional repressor for pyruvate dehydrogenase complex